MQDTVSVATVAEAVADTIAEIRPDFVGDPVEQGMAMAAMALVVGFGIFTAVWVLVKTPDAGGQQTTLTKLGAIGFSLGLSLLVWEVFAITFLGLTGEQFDVPNKLMFGLVGTGIGGAIMPKVQATIIGREQAKRGNEPNGGDGE